MCETSKSLCVESKMAPPFSKPLTICTQISPTLTNYGNISEANFVSVAADITSDAADAGDVALAAPITSLKDYYMTCSISRSSRTMARCVAAAKHAEENPK